MSDEVSHQAAGAPTFTVRDALALAPLRRGLPEVAAGRAGLGRHVRWAHAAEVPHIAGLLKGGELLLTTGMGIGPGADDQARLVADLAVRGVAALVVELGPTIPELPPAMVAAADAHGVPLVALRREIRFVEATEAVHGALLDAEVHVLRRGEDAHRAFTAILLAGGDVPALLTAIAGAIADPVVLEDADGELLAHARHHAGDEAVLAAWGRWRTAPAEDAAVAEVPPDRRLRVVALAVDGPLGPGERAVLGHGASAIALALARGPQDARLRDREQRDVLAGLLEGEEDAEAVAARAWLVGFRHRGPLLSLVVAADEVRAAGAERWGGIRTALRSLDVPVLLGAGPHPGHVLLVAGLRDTGARDAVAGACARAVHDAQPPDTAPALVVAGPAVTAWDELRTALRDTLDTALAARGAPMGGWLDATRPDPGRLLWRLRDAPEVRAFAATTLAPLLAHDERRQLRLLPTLEALLAHGGRKAETARALHLERQSLYHRLARLEEVLGIDLDDEDARLALDIAVRVHRYARAMPQQTARRTPSETP